MHIFCFAPTGSGCPSRAARQLNTQNRLVTVSPWVFAYLITARLKLLLPVRTIATATIVTAATAAPATTAIAYRPCLRAPAPRFHRHRRYRRPRHYRHRLQALPTSTGAKIPSGFISRRHADTLLAITNFFGIRFSLCDMVSPPLQMSSRTCRTSPSSHTRNSRFIEIPCRVKARTRTWTVAVTTTVEVRVRIRAFSVGENRVRDNRVHGKRLQGKRKGVNS